MIGWPEKDPDGYADYSVDWEPTLELNPGDTISTSLWDTHPDLTVENEYIDGYSVGIWVGGGNEQMYEFKNTIQTSGGRIYVGYFKIKVKKQVCVVITI